MATTKTTQFKYIDSTNTGYLRPDELGGRVRSAFFQKTCESEQVGDTIKLTKLPANARITGILFASEELGSAGASLEIGDSGDTDRLVAAFDVGTAAVAYGLRTLRTPTTESPDLGFGYRTTAEVEITATVSAAALSTRKFWGEILYVID